MQRPQKTSLVTQTADIIREHIMTGEIKHTLPGEHTLAAELQVSRKTLRAALIILTNEKLLAESTPGARRKILAKPDRTTDRQQSVGILLPRPQDELHASSQDLFRALRKYMDARHVTLHFHHFPYHAPTHNRKRLETIFKSHHANVWIVWEMTLALSKLMEQLALPTVACGGATTDAIYNVAYDGPSAIQHAFHKLIKAGHQRICHPIDHGGTVNPSFANILKNQNIFTDDALHFPSFDHTTGGMVTMLERLFKRKDPPTAFITGGPYSLITLITWLAKKKLSVPEDISILHIGSDPMLEAIIPQIDYYSTSYAPLARELSRITGILLETAQTPTEGQKFYMDYVPGASMRQISS